MRTPRVVLSVNPDKISELGMSASLRPDPLIDDIYRDDLIFFSDDIKLPDGVRLRHFPLPLQLRSSRAL